MTEQTLIASAMGMCIVFAPIVSFLCATLAWQELKWFMFYYGIKLSKIKVFKAVVWHFLLLIFYLFFTFWFAILSYESAIWLFNFIFGV